MTMAKIIFSGVPQKATLLEHDHRNDFTGEEILFLLRIALLVVIYGIKKGMSLKYNKVPLDKNQAKVVIKLAKRIDYIIFAFVELTPLK